MSKSEISLVIADDHPMVRAGLRSMLAASRITVVGEAGDGQGALDAIRRLKPQVVLMDIRMPGMDGLTAIRHLRQQWPDINIVILTTYNEDALMIEGLRSGARSYLLKDTKRQVLFDTLRAAARGESLLLPDVVAKVVGAGNPNFVCCKFRGSIVALDANSGKRIWKTFTISQAPQKTTKSARGTQLWGPSGGSVWSAPALDPERNRMYVTTGDAYSNPAAPETDAIMALAMDSGKVLWVKQALGGDSWNVGCLEAKGDGRANCPDKPGPDHDFGSSSALVTMVAG